MAYVRDYKKEARNESAARRERRNYITRVRRKLIREGRLRVGDNKQVDHIKPTAAGGANRMDNLRIISAHDNMRRQPIRTGKNKGKIAKENRVNGV